MQQKDHMKRILLVMACIAMTFVSAWSQINMSVSSQAVLMPSDADAISYYRQVDVNDQVCAIIKVVPDNSLTERLVLHTKGGLVPLTPPKGESNYREDSGEWWFWVSPKVTNIMFTCDGYTPTDWLGVSLRPGKVYRVELNVESSRAQVTIFNSPGPSGVKMTITPPQARVSYGKSRYDVIDIQTVTDGNCDFLLDKGRYYFKIESEFYETVTTEITIDKGMQDMTVSLNPSFGYLSLSSSPSGAEVFVDGKSIGRTPIIQSERLSKGEHSLFFKAAEYYVAEQKIIIKGDGGVQTIPRVSLKPQFGEVTLICEDKSADLVISDPNGKEVFRGKSGAKVKLNSRFTYKLEASKPSHVPQSKAIVGSAIEGKETDVKIDAPVPIYGGLQLSTNPTRADVYIDGELCGTTVYFQKILVGNHQIELRKEGYETLSFQVNVERDQTLNISKTLNKVLYRIQNHYNALTGLAFGNAGSIKAHQEGSSIAVTYNLRELSDVSLQVDIMGSNKTPSYVPQEFMSGDVGRRIAAGEEKVIIWNPQEQFPSIDFQKYSLRFLIKDRPSMRFFALINAGYSLDSGATLGFTVGQLGVLGWYVKAMSTLSAPQRTQYECDENGLVDSTLPAYSGMASNFKAFGVAGITYRLGIPLYLNAGLGYGVRQHTWETTDGQWVKHGPESYAGFAIDAGMMCRMDNWVFSVGATLVNKNVDISAGLGYVF